MIDLLGYDTSSQERATNPQGISTPEPRRTAAAQRRIAAAWCRCPPAANISGWWFLATPLNLKILIFHHHIS